MQCPRCKSTNISSIVNTNTHTKGFDGGDACCRISTFWMAWNIMWIV